jgi:hypothetical protein
MGSREKRPIDFSGSTYPPPIMAFWDTSSNALTREFFIEIGAGFFYKTPQIHWMKKRAIWRKLLN